MPEWAIPLVGVAGGVIAALAGVGFSAWLQERRERRKRGADLIARLALLLMDANPRGLVFLAASDQERAQRSGADLHGRWRDLREPFITFAVNSHPAILRTAKETATRIVLSIQATRDAIDAVRGPDETSLRRTAEQQYKLASECLDDVRGVRGWRNVYGASPKAPI